MFIGHPTQYRKEIINNLKRDGVQVNFVGETKSVHGPEREKVIKNAKINLVLHNNQLYRPYPQDISRIFTCGAKHCFMISEPIGDCPIQSLVQCELDQLSDTIKMYLADPVKRQQNVDDVYKEIRLLTMAAEISKNREKMLV